MKKFITCLVCNKRTSLHRKGRCLKCYTFQWKLKEKEARWKKKEEEYKARQREAGGVYAENFFDKP